MTKQGDFPVVPEGYTVIKGSREALDDFLVHVGKLEMSNKRYKKANEKAKEIISKYHNVVDQIYEKWHDFMHEIEEMEAEYKDGEEIHDPYYYLLRGKLEALNWVLGLHGFPIEKMSNIEDLRYDEDGKLI